MRFSRKTLGIPYGVFLLLFVVAPLLVLTGRDSSPCRT